MFSLIARNIMEVQVLSRDAHFPIHISHYKMIRIKKILTLRIDTNQISGQIHHELPRLYHVLEIRHTLKKKNNNNNNVGKKKKTFLVGHISSVFLRNNHIATDSISGSNN